MQVGVGYCDHPDSAIAGKRAALDALSKVERTDTCSFVFLFCTARHNQTVLREVVAKAVGNSRCIYGGGSVGIITNDTFGYAGDQVGVACVWMDDSTCTVLTEDGLRESEFNTGERLGKQLAALEVTPESPVMLFYDAVERTPENMRLLMATWILEGMQKGLGFLPDLNGAGLQGDHVCTPTKQYIGEKMDDHNAMAMVFSDDIRIDSVIMHGCRPASPYYTVTKAEGSMILEINNQPALSFMSELLSPALSPEDFPFFLLFGINWGGEDEEYNEDNYASRLCLNIDKERGGIVMFEPDMVAGTRFQIMFRSLDLHYMEPRINQMFEKLEGREPVFAMYIDCAGRCAGYGGVEMEDAYVIQNAVKDRVPLLGLYTGVEIAAIGGRPRGLDWTGVFCVFSQSKNGKPQKKAAADKPVWSAKSSDHKNNVISSDKMVKLLEQNVAKILSLDVQSIAIRHELEQKRRGFSLLAELSVSLRQESGYESIFYTATTRINAALNMQKTVVLLKDPDGQFVPSVLQGYDAEEKAQLFGRQIALNDELLSPFFVTGADSETHLAELRQTLNLPYFISTPVIVENKVVAVLITGRMVETPPFLSRLGHNDMETVQAIVALLASVLVHQRLDDVNRLAQTDVLTEVYNRSALERQTTDRLNHDLTSEKMFAFLMIDLDDFKRINDSYGHLVGDEALKALARTLKNNFRSTDVIARIGGDEFAVFCKLTGRVEDFKAKAAQIVAQWASTAISANDSTPFYCTLSMGVSIAPFDGSSYDELVQKADIALYEAKRRGRNQCAIYSKNMPQMPNRRSAALL